MMVPSVNFDGPFVGRSGWLLAIFSLVSVLDKLPIKCCCSAVTVVVSDGQVTREGSVHHKSDKQVPCVF